MHAHLYIQVEHLREYLSKTEEVALNWELKWILSYFTVEFNLKLKTYIIILP